MQNNAFAWCRLHCTRRTPLTAYSPTGAYVAPSSWHSKKPLGIASSPPRTRLPLRFDAHESSEYRGSLSREGGSKSPNQQLSRDVAIGRLSDSWCMIFTGAYHHLCGSHVLLPSASTCQSPGSFIVFRRGFPQLVSVPARVRSWNITFERIADWSASDHTFSTEF